MRIVLDTNVMISGLLLEKSIPGELLSLWEAKQYDLITSPEQIDELGRVLNYGCQSGQSHGIASYDCLDDE